MNDERCESCCHVRFYHGEARPPVPYDGACTCWVGLRENPTFCDCKGFVSQRQRIDELEAENARLLARHQDALEWLREFKAEGVYEFTPETAPEGFLQQTIKDLLNDLSAVLEGENE